MTALLVSDDGVTWAETGARLPTATLVGVAGDGATLVAAGGADSFRSTDGGASWTALAPGLPQLGAQLALAPRGTGHPLVHGKVHQPADRVLRPLRKRAHLAVTGIRRNGQ